MQTLEDFPMAMRAFGIEQALQFRALHRTGNHEFAYFLSDSDWGTLFQRGPAAACRVYQEFILSKAPTPEVRQLIERLVPSDRRSSVQSHVWELQAQERKGNHPVLSTLLKSAVYQRASSGDSDALRLLRPDEQLFALCKLEAFEAQATVLRESTDYLKASTVGTHLRQLSSIPGVSPLQLRRALLDSYWEKMLEVMNSSNTCRGALEKIRGLFAFDDPEFKVEGLITGALKTAVVHIFAMMELLKTFDFYKGNEASSKFERAARANYSFAVHLASTNQYTVGGFEDLVFSEFYHSGHISEAEKHGFVLDVEPEQFNPVVLIRLPHLGPKKAMDKVASLYRPDAIQAHIGEDGIPLLDLNSASLTTETLVQMKPDALTATCPALGIGMVEYLFNEVLEISALNMRG